MLSFCASAGAPFASVTLSGVVGSALLRVLLVGCSCTVSVTVSDVASWGAESPSDGFSASVGVVA